MEEIAEVMSLTALGHLDAPCILYDLEGYYAGLRVQLRHMIDTGLSTPERQKHIFFAESLEEIGEILES